MKINNEKIKNLVEKYLKDSFPELIEDIKKELGEYVYYYPRVAFKKNLDICGEFYLYIMERMEKIIKNFPPKASIKFQTWFNYVLKNNFINFMKYSKGNAVTDLSLEDYKETVYVEVFEGEDDSYRDVYSALNEIDSSDKAILKLYYLPELIDEADVEFISSSFDISVSKILEIQRRLIELRYKELENTRKICEKIRVLNSRILKIKYILYREECDNNQKYEMMAKIARLEGERFKNLQRINHKNSEIINCLSELFKSKEKASYRIKIAREKFRFYYLKLKQSGVGS
ncbi:MAG: hypothetical protein ACP5QT_03640 [Brevinematia bacterium]